MRFPAAKKDVFFASEKYHRHVPVFMSLRKVILCRSYLPKIAEQNAARS